jgi:ATP-dependent protease HslVU (ClpYQ), ATPase subunit
MSNIQSNGSSVNILKQLTPTQIVSELDKYIIGQDLAKKSVAIALRNRWRRINVPDEMREEIMPNNIILIGPTGVGKTEIARRISKLTNAPFIKVEASKFTEVGYVGRDVESMIRELTDLSVNIVKEEKMKEISSKAEHNAIERILDILLPKPKKPEPAQDTTGGMPVLTSMESESSFESTREKLRKQLLEGKLDGRMIELDLTTTDTPMMQVLSPFGLDDLGLNLQDMLGSMMPKKTKKRKLPHS